MGKPNKEAAFDAVVEAGIIDPTTIREVPEDLQEALKLEGLPVIEKIRFTRITPHRQGQITDLVMRRYHRDLQDPELLSDERIMEFAVAKGAWTPEQDARLNELQEITTGQLATLYQEGAVRAAEWSTEVEAKAERYLTLVRESTELDDEARDTISTRLKRWLMYSADKKASYTALYQDELGSEPYNPDSDLSFLLDQSPTLEGIDLLNDTEDLKGKIEEYLDLRVKRFELDLLMRKRTEIFSNSVESRQRNAGQMARLFFTSEQVDAAGKSAGKLAGSFDALYELPPEVISWLVEEQFFFHNNIPSSAREALETLGFRKAAEPTNTSDGSSEPLGESPEGSLPSSASPPQDTTAAASSDTATPTT
jgi:hypothetical protein